jgi:adenine phosphoribosyltransferase
VPDLRREVVQRLSFIEGHADVWSIFASGSLLRGLVAALTDPYNGRRITKVAGIEARGFILGGAAAVQLGVGFVAIRKEGGLFPGEKLTRTTAPDYRGKEVLLRLQRQAAIRGDHVLLVDDWIETGMQALTAKELIVEAGAEFVGASVVVDETSSVVRAQLAQFSAFLPRELLDATPT